MYGIKSGEPFQPWLWPVPQGGLIGKKRLGRMDGYEKATGKAEYNRDVHIPGMVFGKVLLSPYAHAKIVSMDTSKASALPGVIDILRYDDATIPWFFARNFTWLGDTAHHYPQPVGAMVIARSEALCEQALKLIEIEWEQLPVMLYPEESLADGAVIMRPDLNPDNNISSQRITEIGDVEKGFEESDNILEFTVKMEEEGPIGTEPLSTVAHFRGDQVDVWYHGQCQEMVKESIASLNIVKLDKIRMHLPYNGGTWGGGGAYHLEISRLAVIAAKRTDLPVKVICDNDSLFHRPGEALGTYKYKIGYNDDGIIKSVKLDSTFNSAFGDQINKIDKCTKIPNLYCLDTKPYLTRGPIGCFKHGKEASSVMNFVFGHVASELKMDPGELALLNDGTYQEDWEWVNENVKKRLGFPLDRDSLKECLEIGKNAVDWESKWHEPGTKILPNGNYHGIGLSWQVAWQNAGMRRASAGAYINWDGSLNIQGTRSIVGTNEEMTNAQILSDEMGVNLEDISFMRHDNIFALASAGNSENLQNNAAWAVRISKQMKQLLCEYAADPKIPGRPSLFPDKKPEELDVKNSEVYEVANPENKQPIKAVVQRCSYTAGPEGCFGTPFFVRDINPTVDEPHYYQMNRQVYFTEVEVNPDTGQTTVTNVVTVYDCGRLINPDSLEGQQYGGLYMGLGRSNAECVYLDPQTGVRLNDNLIGYPVYLMNDLGTLQCSTIETGLGWGPYGGCGCSEAPAATTATATNAAIYNAIGKWVNYSPTTPDRVLQALGKA